MLLYFEHRLSSGITAYCVIAFCKVIVVRGARIRPRFLLGFCTGWLSKIVVIAWTLRKQPKKGIMDLTKIGSHINRTAACTTHPLGFALSAALNVIRYFMRRSGPIARALRYPNPLKRQWKGPVLELAPTSGLGETLMCTPVLRELKRRNPRCHFRFYTEFGPLVNGLPYIDEVLPYDQKPAGVLDIRTPMRCRPRCICRGS